MKEQPCTLLAFDSDGGQAIFRQGDRWFRAAADDGWAPTELQDRRFAVRCTLLAPYEAREETHATIDELVAAIATAWDESSDVEDVPLSEVVHLFPEPVRRAWETQQEGRRREQERLNAQSERLRREVEAERRPSPQTTPPPLWWPRWPRPPWPLPPIPEPEPSWLGSLDIATAAVWKFTRPRAHETEDVASEAALRLARHLDRNRGLAAELASDESRFARLVWMIVRNTSWRRRRKREEAHLSLERDRAAIPADALVDRTPEYALHRLEINEAIGRAIERLPAREAAVVVQALLLKYPLLPPPHVLKLLRYFLKELGLGPEDLLSS